MKDGFALYDTKRYSDALAVFQRMEKFGGERVGAALVWQGHMLDLLNRRQEAIAAYEKAKENSWTSDMISTVSFSARNTSRNGSKFPLPEWRTSGKTGPRTSPRRRRRPPRTPSSFCWAVGGFGWSAFLNHGLSMSFIRQPWQVLQVIFASWVGLTTGKLQYQERLGGQLRFYYGSAA